MSTETDTQPLTAWEIELADSLLVDVDLSRDVPCVLVDGRDGPPCERPAAWVVVNGCCGLTNTYCPQHRVECIRDMQIMRKVCGVRCVRCKTPNPSATWRPL